MNNKLLSRHIVLNVGVIVALLGLVVCAFIYLYKITPPTKQADSPATGTSLTFNEAKKITPNPQPMLGNNSNITSLDSTWNRYTNADLGISIDIPKLANAGCTSSSLEPTLYPVYVVEDRQNVVIASSIGTQTIDMGCSNAALTETDIRNGIRINYPNLEYSSWTIRMHAVKNDKDIDTYIKDTYGSGCSLGNRVESKQAGVYDISIKTDGKSLDETLCPINFGVVLKHSTQHNKLANWNLGQDLTFYDGRDTVYDTRMLTSFKFN